MRTTVLKNFSYMECDDFAAYLCRMSAKGWHFAEWRIGLVFEKGEPADITYAVEVFPKGSEMDTFANPDAEEFAEYCEAAGWKFLDSRRKFCIFRRERADALPITEPPERLRNILQAERKSWLSQFFSGAVIFLLYWWQFLAFSFSHWIFNNLMLLVLAVLFINLACSLGKGCILLVKSCHFRRVLKAGALPRYGTGNRVLKLLKNYRLLVPLLAELALIAIAWQDAQHALAISLAATFLAVLAVCLLIAHFRPSRSENWIIQLSLGLAVPLLAMICVAVLLSSNDSPFQNEPQNPKAPFSQELLGEYTLKDQGHLASIAGSADYYYVNYNFDQTGSSDFFTCWSYRSPHAWILDRIWNQETNADKMRYQDCTAEWDAVLAYRSQGGACYYIRYPNQVIVLWIAEALDSLQIESLQQTLR